MSRESEVRRVTNEEGHNLSLIDGGKLDEILAAVTGAVGPAGQFVKAAHDAVHLDFAVLTGVHCRLELKENTTHETLELYPYFSGLNR